MDEKTKRRLDQLISPAYQTDPVYHTIVDTFRSWLLATEMALQDEGVSNTTIERVLNRLVYATPSGPSDHPETITINRSALEDLIMNQDLRRRQVVISPFQGTDPPRPTRPGHRDVADLYVDKGQHGPHPT